MRSARRPRSASAIATRAQARRIYRGAGGSSLLLDATDLQIASLAYWNGYVYGLMEIEPVGTTVPEIEWFRSTSAILPRRRLPPRASSPGPRSAPASGVQRFAGGRCGGRSADQFLPPAAPTCIRPIITSTRRRVVRASARRNLYQASTGFFNSGASGAQRWGAYSTAIVDPNNPNSFWISNEYVANNWWQTATAQVQLSTGAVAPPADNRRAGQRQHRHHHPAGDFRRRRDR